MPGLAAPPRRIWLCADDYGISTAVNTAIRDLVVRGRLNATSVMMVAPSSHRSEAGALAALNSVAPRVALGLHLTLTAPFRPLSAGFGPLQDGHFLPLVATFVHATLRRFGHHALKAEIERQLEAFRDTFGHAPDFIDGHQHVHLFPQIGRALLEVVTQRVPGTWLRQCGRVVPWSQRLADRKGLLLDLFSWRFRRRAASLGLRTNPGFAGTYEFNNDTDFASLFPRFLEALPDGGLVMCHPGFVDAELRRLDPLTTLREKEYAYLTGDEFLSTLAAHGMTLAPASAR